MSGIGCKLSRIYVALLQASAFRAKVKGALRIGLGKFTTDEEIERAAEILSTAANKIRQAMLT